MVEILLDYYFRLLLLLTELFKFEIQKCGQILCAHKPYFLMLGHICYYITTCFGLATLYIYIYIYIYIIKYDST